MLAHWHGPLLSMNYAMKNEPVEVTAASLCRLLGITRNTLSDLAKRGIVVKGEKRGSYFFATECYSVLPVLAHSRGRHFRWRSYSEAGAQYAIAQ